MWFQVTAPSGVRFSVTGNVVSVKGPRSTWSKYFKEALTETPLAPIRLANATLSKLGRAPSKKVIYDCTISSARCLIIFQAVVVALPSIESSFATHYAKGLQGFSHSEYPALRIAAEVLNATESYLWVCSL